MGRWGFRVVHAHKVSIAKKCMPHRKRLPGVVGYSVCVDNDDAWARQHSIDVRHRLAEGGLPRGGGRGNPTRQCSPTQDWKGTGSASPPTPRLTTHPPAMLRGSTLAHSRSTTRMRVVTKQQAGVLYSSMRSTAET